MSCLSKEHLQRNENESTCDIFLCKRSHLQYGLSTVDSLSRFFRNSLRQSGKYNQRWNKRKPVDFMQSCCRPLRMTWGRREPTWMTCHPQCHPQCCLNDMSSPYRPCILPIILISWDFMRLHEISPRFFPFKEKNCLKTTLLKLYRLVQD